MTICYNYDNTVKNTDKMIGKICEMGLVIYIPMEVYYVK